MSVKILVPVDGSDNSLRAAAYVYRLAEEINNPEVTFLNVVRPLFDEKDDSVRLYIPGEELRKIKESWISQARKSNLEKLGQITGSPGLRPPGEITVIEGEAAQTIVEFAAQGNFDLIVMGARGLSNLQGVLLGSVSQKVLHLAKCPVLVVK